MKPRRCPPKGCGLLDRDVLCLKKGNYVVRDESTVSSDAHMSMKRLIWTEGCTDMYSQICMMFCYSASPFGLTLRFIVK